MKGSGIGGQAVMEGIMMKNGDRYAVGVRKADKEIIVKKSEYPSFIKGKKFFSLPFVRGVFNFVDSLVLGMKTLTYSAGFFEDDEEEVRTKEPSKLEKKLDAFFDTKRGIVRWDRTICAPCLRWGSRHSSLLSVSASMRC